MDAFENCYSLQKVNLENTLIEKIDDFAFKSCRGLKEILFPNDVIYIGYDAFMGCTSLTDVSFPSELRRIAACGFAYSGITKADFTNVKNKLWIDDYAFFECKNLEEVYLPNNCYLGSGIFAGCSSLKRVVILSNELANFSPILFDNCSSLREIYMSQSIIDKHHEIISEYMEHINFIPLEKMPLDLLIKTGKTLKEINKSVLEQDR